MDGRYVCFCGGVGYFGLSVFVGGYCFFYFDGRLR